MPVRPWMPAGCPWGPREPVARVGTNLELYLDDRMGFDDFFAI